MLGPEVMVRVGFVKYVIVAVAEVLHPVETLVMVYKNVYVPVPDGTVTLVVGEVGVAIVTGFAPEVLVHNNVSPVYIGLFPTRTKEVLPSQKL